MAKDRKITAENESEDSSKPLINSRWEAFCQNIIKGDDLGDAYLNAGYTLKGKMAASVNANKLLKNTNIANRLAFLKKQAADRMIITVTEVLENMTKVIDLNTVEVLENLRKYGKFINRIKFKTVYDTEDIVDEGGKIAGKRRKARQVVKDITLVSKEKMYELIGRYYSMFTDNIEVVNKTPLHQKLAEKLIEKSSESIIDDLLKDNEPNQ